MDHKKEYKRLVEQIKDSAKAKGGKLRNEDIAEVLGYNRAYFSSLTGTRGNVTEDHIKDLKLHFPELSENVTRETTQPPINGVRQPKTETDPEIEGIVYIPISAQAGYSKRYVDPIFKSSLQKIFIPGMPYRGENYRIWEVEGNSMEPTFKEHFHILTERVEPPFKNIKEWHAYVIVTEDDVLLKRLARHPENKDIWVLISDNEELYPQFPIKIDLVKELWFVRRKMDWEMSPPKRFEIKL